MKTRTILTLLLVAASAAASEPLETETARVMGPGAMKVEAVSEFQRSKEGTERAFPFVFEVGLGHNTEIAVEPVFGTAIRPKIGTHASGIGDVSLLGEAWVLNPRTHERGTSRGSLAPDARTARRLVPGCLLLSASGRKCGR